MKTILDERAWPRLRFRRAVAESTDASEQAATGARSRDLSLRYIVVQAALLWCVSRLIILCATYCEMLLTLGSRDAATMIHPRGWLNLWQQLDVTWYLRIAATGYAPDLTRAAFFPLYPMLVHVVTPLVGGEQHALAAAMVVSNLGALAAFIGIGLLATREDSSSTGPIAMRMLAAYPFAFFMVAGYAESLFVALAAFALFFARRRSWRWAAACGFLAGLTRPTAVILIAPLFWEYGWQHGVWQGLWQSVRARKWRGFVTVPRLRMVTDWALVTASVPAAIALYALYLDRTFGDPLLFVHLQTIVWHRDTLPPAQLASLAIASWQHALPWSAYKVRILLDYVPIGLFAVLTVALARRLPMLYTLFMLGVLVTSVSSPMVGYIYPFDGAGRYLLPSIPIFLLLGMWAKRHPSLDTLLTGGGFALQVILATYFIMGNWLI